jgi:hypothetical protein
MIAEPNGSAIMGLFSSTQSLTPPISRTPDQYHSILSPHPPEAKQANRIAHSSLLFVIPEGDLLLAVIPSPTFPATLPHPARPIPEAHLMSQSPRALLLIAISLLPVAALAQQTRTPVLVELFTSEGCSSCPPADAILAKFDHEQPVPTADIIVLGEHVDYWDKLGWRDRFSSADFTQRQTDYRYLFKLDDIYTPQAVVNGSAQLNGTDRDGIRAAIQGAALQTVPLQFASVQVHRDAVTFTLQNSPSTHSEYVRVYAALVDPADTTEVHGGENNSRTLHHAGVVRTLSMVGESWHMKNLGEHPFTVRLRAPGTVNGMRLVVFAQTKPIGPVLGSASCVLRTTPAPAAVEAPFPANPCPAAPQSVAAVQ